MNGFIGWKTQLLLKTFRWLENFWKWWSIFFLVKKIIFIYLFYRRLIEKPEEELDGYRRKVCGLEKDNETNNLDTFRQDLENADVELAEKVCKLIADLAKDETCRDKFIEKGFFPIVNKHLEVSLKVPLDNEKVLLLKIQICRAIGNLCYYCGKNFISSNFLFIKKKTSKHDIIR